MARDLSRALLSGLLLLGGDRAPGAGPHGEVPPAVELDAGPGSTAASLMPGVPRLRLRYGDSAVPARATGSSPWQPMWSTALHLDSPPPLYLAPASTAMMPLFVGGGHERANWSQSWPFVWEWAPSDSPIRITGRVDLRGSPHLQMAVRVSP